MGGRAAERIAFGVSAVSTGASSDIQTATALAFNMVAKWGMSKTLGPLSYYPEARNRLLSQQTARQIDLEVCSLPTV